MGDILFIHDAGAHGFFNGLKLYNGKLKSAELLLKEKRRGSAYQTC
jgi:diaminopimelate decarboxylase